jgi:hypothetical protein
MEHLLKDLTVTQLAAHIKAEPFRTFPKREWSEAFIIAYKVFAWAMRDKADMVLVLPGGFIWFRHGVSVGKLVSQTLIPEPGYAELLEKISTCDRIMHLVVIPYRKTERGITYTLNFPRVD